MLVFPKLMSRSQKVPDTRAALLATLVVLSTGVLGAGGVHGSTTVQSGNVTVYRAANVTVDSTAALESAIENGSVKRTAEVVLGQTFARPSTPKD